MTVLSDYMEANIVNWIKGTAFPAAPTAVYVALYNGSPTDTGTGGTEVTTTVRTAGRVAIPFGTATDGVISNSAIVDFGTAAGAATVSHIGIFTAATGGNLISYSANTGTTAVTAGSAVTIAANAVTITVA